MGGPPPFLGLASYLSLESVVGSDEERDQDGGEDHVWSCCWQELTHDSHRRRESVDPDIRDGREPDADEVVMIKMSLMK